MFITKKRIQAIYSVFCSNFLIIFVFLQLKLSFSVNLFRNFHLFILFNINYNTYDNAFNKECYDFINGEQNKNNTEECFDHTIYRNYLSCHLGVAPSESKLGRVLVLGSAGKIGLSLTKLLKEKKIPYVEVRGRYQFDLNNSQIYEIFGTLNITHVFDLVRNIEGEKLHDLIFNYFNKKKIIVTRVVDDQIDSKYDQVISHEAFGNQYMRQDTSQIFKNTFYCIVKNKCNSFPFSNKKLYALSHEISHELLNSLSQKVPKIKKILFKTFREEQIWNKVLLFQKNKLTNADDLYPIFSDILKASIERMSKPFLSVSYLTTNDEKHYSKAGNMVRMFQKVVDEYPDISLEMTFFWVMNVNNSKFTDCIKFDSKLNFPLHVIDVTKDNLQTVLHVLKTEFIPEYFFRDISLILAKGEFLTTGSSDVYPSPSFFEIAQRKLVSPFVILKSDRIRAPEFNESFLNYFEKQEKVNSFLDNATNPTRFFYYYLNALGHTGDIQGAIRQTMNALNGWIFNKHTYGVDASFIWDLMMFKVPFYIVNMPKSMHQHHKSVSYLTPRFKISPKVRSTMFFCNAIPTKYIDGYERKNWGVSFDFIEKSRKKKIIRFGHLVYNIVKANDTNNTDEIYLKKSRIEFKIIYNNNKTNFK